MNDSITPDVIRFIKQRKKISCKSLQKKFNIGYSRAARILNQLSSKGYLSKAEPSRARKVL